MRIVFYSVSTSLYGAPTSLLNLIQGLVRQHRGIEIYVIVPSAGPLTKELDKLPISTIVLPFYKWIYRSCLFTAKKRRNSFIAFLWFYKNLFQKLFLNLFYLPLHLKRVGKIGPDLIYVNASMSCFGIVVAKLLGIKSVWHHREPLNDQETDFYLEWSPKIAKTILSWPNLRIYNSQFLKGMYDESFPFKGKSYVVFNGVPAARSLCKDKKERTVFGMVGKIEPGLRKGHEEIIGLFNYLKDNSLLLNIYGDGEPSYIQSLKTKCDPDLIVFKGFKPGHEIYREMHFLVMNSRNESFGRVVVEGYSYGVPVFALRSGALPEIVDEGRTGFIYENQQQLMRLVEGAKSLTNKVEYQRMQEYCIQKFNDNFTIEIYAKSIVKILKNV